MKSDKGKLGLVVFFGLIYILGAAGVATFMIYMLMNPSDFNLGTEKWKLTFDQFKGFFTGDLVWKIGTFELPIKWAMIASFATAGAGWLASMITIFAGRWTSGWCRKSFVIFGILSIIPLMALIFGAAGLANLKKKDGNYHKKQKGKSPMYQQPMVQPMMQQPMMQPMMQQMPQQPMMQQPMMAQPVMMAPNTNSSMSQNSQLIPFYIPIEHIDAFRIATAAIANSQPVETAKSMVDGEAWSFDEF